MFILISHIILIIILLLIGLLNKQEKQIKSMFLIASFINGEILIWILYVLIHFISKYW